MAGPKAASLRLLARLRLLGPAYRAYEEARALRARRDGGSHDGIPLPPPSLRVQVAGTPDARWFVESGRAAAGAIRHALERHGGAVEGSVLDFGCGCGRVLRHFAGAPAQLHGSDANERLIAWCRANLPFARFETNGLTPPLPYADASFDLVYALSVLTHLPEELQRPWLDELRRIVRPGGRVLVTTHGERYVERLTPDERELFAAGGLVVRWAEVAGTNLCTAFHPPAYVRDTLARGFVLEELEPEGAAGNPHQDLVLLRRP